MIDNDALANVRNRLIYEGYYEGDVEEAINRYEMIIPFNPDQNIYESGQEIDPLVHKVMRYTTEYYLTKAFHAMKIDMNNVNVAPNEGEGNIGTPGRIAKMWCGKDPDDTTELLSGRWNKPPRMAIFDTDSDNETPVFITTQLRGVCSHHLIGFHDIPSNPNSLVVIGYIPKDRKKGGISKISRFVNYAARRMWLQEDLTEYIGKTIESNFKTDSVYVGLINISHGCSWTRGANDTSATTTTTYISGKFIERPDLIPEKYKG